MINIDHLDHNEARQIQQQMAQSQNRLLLRSHTMVANVQM
jgi:hypothetical protein